MGAAADSECGVSAIVGFALHGMTCVEEELGERRANGEANANGFLQQ